MFCCWFLEALTPKHWLAREQLKHVCVIRLLKNALVHNWLHGRVQFQAADFWSDGEWNDDVLICVCSVRFLFERVYWSLWFRSYKRVKDTFDVNIAFLFAFTFFALFFGQWLVVLSSAYDFGLGSLTWIGYDKWSPITSVAQPFLV